VPHPQGYRIGNADSEDSDEESWYYWELVVVSRKIAIIIISVRKYFAPGLDEFYLIGVSLQITKICM
jgi:hypothetical protein